MSFEHPAWLIALPLTALPWLWHGQKPVPWPSLQAYPADPWSDLVALGLRLATSLAIASMAMSLAGPYREGRAVERFGTGAHVVILLDRSASMTDTFAGAPGARPAAGPASSPAPAGTESKGQAAARLLEAFVEQRPRDLIGLIEFSTAPIPVLGLSADHRAIRSAISATAVKGTGLTDLTAGLSLAVDQFRDRPRIGSRVVLLVSDGAAGIDIGAQSRLRRAVEEHQLQLYWIYLRVPGGNSPTRAPTSAARVELAPEFYLDQFFRSLGGAYRLYEADDPQSLQAAVEDVSRLQNMPLRYVEDLPRQPLSPLLDIIALVATLIGLLARALEQPRWGNEGKLP